MGSCGDVVVWLGAYAVAVLGFGFVTVAALWSYARECMDNSKQQEKPKGVPFDFNGNGVPDYQESWFWGGVWHVAASLVTTFAKPHTVAYRAVEKARQFESQARGGGR